MVDRYACSSAFPKRSARYFSHVTKINPCIALSPQKLLAHASMSKNTLPSSSPLPGSKLFCSPFWCAQSQKVSHHSSLQKRKRFPSFSETIRGDKQPQDGSWR